VVADRSNLSAVSFAETSRLTSISDSRHVDGYVKRTGSNHFIFPVGQNGKYRPFAAEGRNVSGAYFAASPGAAQLPSGAPFDSANKDANLSKVASNEYWDINGIDEAKLTLTWNQASDVGTLTGNVLSKLTIAGWNAATSRWEQIPSVVDEIALIGGNSTLSSGSISLVTTLVPDKYVVYTLASLVSPATGPAFDGALEIADCGYVSGWAWNKTYPDAILTIDVFDGETVVASSLANIDRPDLKARGIGSGSYGFNVKLPANMTSDGVNHSVSVRVRNTSFALTGSPKVLNCGFKGSFEAADCNRISGWIWNKNNPAGNAKVQLSIDAQTFGVFDANIFREDLKNSGTGTGNYGFSVSYPVNLRDGKVHNLSVRLDGSNYELEGSPKTVTCATDQYQGVIELASCNEVSGWVWNKTYPNDALIVELVEGSTVLASGPANIYKEYLKTGGYGNGAYGYKFALPASLKDGQAHQLSVRVKGTSYVLGRSPQSVICAVNEYKGVFEFANCNELSGWVWDKNDPAAALTVELVEGSTVLATGPANIYKEYLKTGGYGTGNYGFKFTMPAAIKDGKAHQLSVRVKGSTYVLGSSPQTITCAINEYKGVFEFANCNEVSGWVWDKNAPAAALTVELMEGSTVLATGPANIYKEYLKTGGYGTGNYGFKFTMPASVKDGKAHQLSVRVKGSTYVLGSSPQTITCAVNEYKGVFEYVNCNEVGGWVWDKNDPSTAQTVELLEGNTVLATGPANIYKEYLKTGGYGTGNYGFKFPMPASLKDGKAHQLTVRVKGTSYVLGSSPLTITCAVNAYQGVFEFANCNEATGWVWDRNAPAAALTVELFEGSTALASGLANIYKEYLKTGGYGTGSYAFKIPLPASVKDGKAHQLSVRVKGTSFVLSNSLKTLTCNAAAAREAGGAPQSVDLSKTGLEMKEVPINLNVFPNPTIGDVTISLWLGDHKTCRISIVNSFSGLIQQCFLTGTGTVMSANFKLSAQPSGIYFVTVEGESVHEVRKLVIVR